MIAEGKAGFYCGRVAEAMVEAVQARGGALSMADLAAHTTDYPEPLSVGYRGCDVCESAAYARTACTPLPC